METHTGRRVALPSHHRVREEGKWYGVTTCALLGTDSCKCSRFFECVALHARGAQAPCAQPGLQSGRRYDRWHDRNTRRTLRRDLGRTDDHRRAQTRCFVELSCSGVLPHGAATTLSGVLGEARGGADGEPACVAPTKSRGRDGMDSWRLHELLRAPKAAEPSIAYASAHHCRSTRCSSTTIHDLIAAVN